MSNKLETKKYIRISWSGELGIITKILKDSWVMWKPVGYIYSKRIKILKNDGILISENILDLIKDEDIIEIEISEEWATKENSKVIVVLGKDIAKEQILDGLENGIYKIKRILTKEKYMNNSLEV